MQTLGRRSQVWDSLAVFGFADLVDQSVFDPQKSVCGLSQSLIGDRRGEGSDLWNVSLALDQLGERSSYPTRRTSTPDLRADRRSQSNESARTTCRVARANKHVKLTSSLRANENLSL
jgi:hypothetical protein